ncbi:hypothetical protein HG536_0A07970 [Torulaspora globosa]|uniref:Uncharacterized protein n=1 Tax=Torulaspora globosa TaxID=48254 RepID=A0A7G3ZBU6_9SACH|nr:uncharacterized protein HG536_0A07970 [Torulaspora globosa]QLL30982.1 hypothetical protein HG536_0A07970 [Torulaspora globosa]
MALLGVRNCDRWRGHSIFHPMLRGYATTQGKKLDWDMVFNPRSSKRKALNQFKKNLLYLAEKGLTPSAGSQEYEAVRYLSCQGTRSIRKLCEMIMQHRVNEHQVWEAIVRVSHRDPANIAVPQKLETSSRVHPKLRPMLKIRPQAVDLLEDVIDKVEKSQAKEPSSREDAVAFDEPKPRNCTSSIKQRNIQDIDVQSLGNYLQKAGQYGERRRRYTWENQRHFSWEHATNGPFTLSAGEVLFPNPMYKRYKKKPLENLKHKASTILSLGNKGSRYEQDKPTELLVYNLVSKKQRVIPVSNDSSLFNINYKDLFGIINSSKNAPEETLSIINQFEGKGWTLIGDLYDNSQTIAFQRTVVPSSHAAKALARSPWLWAAILSALLFGSYSLSSLALWGSDEPLDRSSGNEREEA